MKQTGLNKGREGLIKTSRYKDGYTRRNQPRSTYLTTYQLAEELGKWLGTDYPGPPPSQEKILRWCRIWFGQLPAERVGGRGMGYRIPLEYRYVARAWQQLEDERPREVVRQAILVDQKPWVVVIANSGSTHYNVEEMLERVRQVSSAADTKHLPVHITNVGPMED